MEAANQSGSGLRLRHALAGLQAGVLGALAILGCLAAGSLLNKRSVWVGPNLFATTFYGAGAYYNHYARTGWAGVALVIVLYGAFGALWGCAWREEQKPLLAVYGAIVGLLVYFVFFDFAWKQVNGLVVLYAPSGQLQLGHVVWGMLLAKSPGYSRGIAQRLRDFEPGVQASAAEPAMSSGPAAQ